MFSSVALPRARSGVHGALHLHMAPKVKPAVKVAPTVIPGRSSDFHLRPVRVLASAAFSNYDDDESNPSDDLNDHRNMVEFSRQRFLKFVSEGDINPVQMAFVVGFEDDASQLADVDSLWHRGRWRAMYLIDSLEDLEDSDSDSEEGDLLDSDPIVLLDSGVGGQPPLAVAGDYGDFPGDAGEGAGPEGEDEDEDPLSDSNLPQEWMMANHRSTWSLERFKALAAEAYALYLKKISEGEPTSPATAAAEDDPSPQQLADRRLSSHAASSSSPLPDSPDLRAAFLGHLLSLVERLEQDPYHMSTKEQVKVLANLARLPPRDHGHLFDRCEAILRGPLVQALLDDEMESEQVASLLEAYCLVRRVPDAELLRLCVQCTAMEADQYGREELPTFLFALADLELRDAFRTAEANLRPQLLFMLERDGMDTFDLLNTLYAYSRAQLQPKSRVLVRLAENLLRRVEDLDKPDLCNCQLALIDFKRPPGGSLERALKRLEDALEARWKQLDLQEGVAAENSTGEEDGEGGAASIRGVDMEAARRLWMSEFGGRSLAEVLDEYAQSQEEEGLLEEGGSRGEDDPAGLHPASLPDSKGGKEDEEDDSPLVISLDIDLFGLAPFYEDVQEVMARKAAERDQAIARAEALERATSPSPPSTPAEEEASSKQREAEEDDGEPKPFHPSQILGNLGARGMFLSPQVHVDVLTGNEAVVASASDPEPMAGFLFDFSDLKEEAPLLQSIDESGSPLPPASGAAASASSPGDDRPSSAAAGPLTQGPVHVTHLVEAVNEVLFHRHGYRRAEGPLLPHHHMIHRVLEEGEGSPVVLGMIYQEVCRRVGLPMSARVLEDYLVVFPTHEPLGPADCPMVVDVYSAGELMKMDEVSQVFDLDPSQRTKMAPSTPREVVSALLKSMMETYWKLATGCTDPNQGADAAPSTSTTAASPAPPSPSPSPLAGGGKVAGAPLDISLDTVAKVGRPRIVRTYDLQRAVAAAERRVVLHKGTPLEAEATLQLGLLHYFSGHMEDSWLELARTRELRGKDAPPDPILDILVERLRLLVEYSDVNSSSLL